MPYPLEFLALPEDAKNSPKWGFAIGETPLDGVLTADGLTQTLRYVKTPTVDYTTPHAQGKGRARGIMARRP